MKGLRWEAALVGFVALAATLAATERTPLTWDEGDAFVRAERVAAWARAVVVGPQRLKEAFEADEVNSQTDADFNGSNGQAASDSVATARVASSGSNGSDGSDGSDGQAASDSVAAVRVASSKAPSNSTRLALLNAESRGASGTGGAETSSEAGPTDRKKRERRRFGDVERAALDYFARFEGRRALFSAKAVEAGWPHTIYREGHPAGYSIAIASGRAFTLRFLPFLSEKAAFRFGPIALFAAALAAVFYRVARNWGRSAAVLAIIGIISIPRAFGHAQLAGGDSLLISSWLLAWAFFDAALASKRGAVALGAAVGVSFCAKFSGFTIVLPLTAGTFAACWARRRVGRRGRAKIGELRDEEKKGGTKDGGTRRDGALATFGRLTLAFVVAAAIFFVANPPLWPRPFDGFETFASLNLRRDGFDIPIYFLGKFYSPTRPLPWWSGFFWVATTVPTALLAFAALGAVAPAFRKNWGNGAVGKNSELTANGEAAKASRGEDGGGAGVVGLTASRGEDGGGAGVVGLTASRDEAGGGIVVAGLTASRSVASRKEETGGGAPLGKEEETVVGAPLGKEEGAVGGRSGRRLAGLAFAFAATLPFVRVIPGIPTHDGARLLIASFPFVAILAALGAALFVEWSEGTATAFSERAKRKKAATLDAVIDKIAQLEGKSVDAATKECRKRIWEKWEEWGEREEPIKRKRNAKMARRLAQVVVLSAFASVVVDLTRSAPQYLSFYNATLGGVVGATRRGMEATYYWDAFDADAVAWLNAEIAAARSEGRPSGVLFGSFSSQTLDYYRRWGTLATPEIETLSTPNALANRERFGFYVVQRRPSGWTALELALFKTARPIYRKTARNPFGFGRRAVVLLEIYDFRDVERVLTAAEKEARPTEKRKEAQEQ